jgi:hypothetical protein
MVKQQKKIVNNYVAKHNPHKCCAHKDRTKYDRKRDRGIE